MSTKIYYGFKFKSKDFFEIFKELKAIRTKCKALVTEQMTEFMARRSVTLLDRYSYFKEKFPKPPAPIIDTWFEVMERIKKIKTTNQRDPEIDFEFKIAIFPHEGEYFGISYTEQNSLRKALESSTLYEEYAYWNNTDAPENLSEEDWKERGDTWDNILGKEGIPAFVSTSYDILDMVNDLPQPVASEILPKVPSLIVRLRDLSSDLMFQDYVRSKGLNNQSKPSDYVNAFGAFKEWIKTPEGIAARDDREEMLAKHLILNVTVDHLVGDTK